MYDGTPRPPLSTSAHKRHALRATAAAVALSAALLTAGCGSPQDTAEDAKATASPAAGFPVTVDNCGVKTTYDKPPSRVVTIHQHPAELMLALGLQDRMVGTAFPDSAVLPELEKDYKAIPQLARKEPSFETILEAEPDLVYGGYGSAFAENEGRSRKAFADAGIDTHLNREYCGKRRVTMKDTYDEIRTIGRIFGVPERAGELIADLTDRVDKAATKVEDEPGTRVFVYDSGDKTAFTAGGKSLGTELIRLAGGRNVFADLDDVFGDVSWEQVVARKPEVIAVYDYADAGSVEQKKKFLLSQPALKDVPAVRNKRFVVLPLTATLVGIRSAHAVEDLARGIHPESFA
ncbi:ABC transporter substrate-binding protein [Streptomyces sp. WAC 00631]|uniref:ABC transporter substrate-binding protein n=1 Tax=unclassified Streptomyces TaxID=2593676 RepID=UPI000F794E75|nr:MULTISPECIES: ABC transporter substrate-binding protein [unclassified Streptomyces]MCC5035963.1 ABC transporter substrate-binding protein [Streptomyces sp. WAC 00631]MCC9738996.1 ABC transporter substrate-binding protein [Streptomyces sp. MNU89]